MFLRIHLIVVFACIGLGMGSLQFLQANSPYSGNDLLSVFRTSKNTAAKDEETPAMSYHRPVR